MTGKPQGVLLGFKVFLLIFYHWSAGKGRGNLKLSIKYYIIESYKPTVNVVSNKSCIFEKFLSLYHLINASITVIKTNTKMMCEFAR